MNFDMGLISKSMSESIDFDQLMKEETITIKKKINSKKDKKINSKLKDTS